MFLPPIRFEIEALTFYRLDRRLPLPCCVSSMLVVVVLVRRLTSSPNPVRSRTITDPNTRAGLSDQSLDKRMGLGDRWNRFDFSYTEDSQIASH